MKIITEFKQGSDEWDTWRSKIATPSEFSKIFTGGGKVSAQRESYMRSCAVSRKYKLPSWSGNEYTKRGHELECVARDIFRERTKLDVREVAGIEHDNGLCGLSPDGLIYDSCWNLAAGLEIKCLNYNKHVGIITKGVLPTEFKPQVHGSLFITALPCWQFMVYHDQAQPLECHVIETEPDQYTKNLGEEVMKFCEELDRRAEEFISDFEKTLTGESILAAMPILQKSLETESLI